jgi:hypothetical protein
MRTVRRDSIRITRIDVAVDLPVSIKDVHGVGEQGRKLKITTYLGPQGLETIEVGSKESDLLIKQYDKRRERSDRGATQPGTSSPLTRIEARLHRLSLKPDELTALKNPFRSLRLFLLRPDGLPLDRRYLVAHARVFGLPDLKARISPELFKAVQSDLEASNRTPIIPHPRDVFDAKWSGVARTLISKLLPPVILKRRPLTVAITKQKRPTALFYSHRPFMLRVPKHKP